eukprot:3628143-Rhodomonas_salina.7
MPHGSTAHRVASDPSAPEVASHARSTIPADRSQRVRSNLPDDGGRARCIRKSVLLVSARLVAAYPTSAPSGSSTPDVGCNACLAL